MPNLGGLLAGLSGLPQGFIQGQQAVDQHQRAQQLMQMQQAQFQQQQLQRQQQAQATSGFLALLKNMPQQQQAGFGDQVPTTLPGGTGVGIQPGGVPGAPPGLAPGFSRDASGMITQNGQAPTAMMPGGVPAWEFPTMRGIIQQDETGGRNIPNQQGPGGTPASTASGYYQITDPTWRDNAPAMGAGQYPRAMSAPASAQSAVTDRLLTTRGLQPWQSNPKLIADATAALTQAGIPTGDVQPALEGAAQAKASIPQAVAGKVPVQNMAQLIEKVMPDASDEAKVGALMMLHNYLAPDAKQQMAVMMAEFKGQMQQQLRDTETPFQKQELGLRERELADREQRGTAAAGGGGLEQSKTLEILDKDDNVTRTVLAREGKNKAGFVDSATGAPLDLKSGEHVREVTPSQGGGGRAGAQVLRQEIGGREVLSDLQNVMTLPLGTTTGMLGGVEPGSTISEALKGDLVRKITGQDAQLMQASMASMTRELSILMSPVYGGGWAAKQIEPLVPKEGDTLGTVTFKIARMAQTANNALEAVSKSPILSGEQKQYAKDLQGEINKAITWTPQQALTFARSNDPNKKFSDFIGTGSKAGGQSGAPSGGQVPTITSKEQYDALQPGAPFIWNGKQGTKP